MYDFKLRNKTPVNDILFLPNTADDKRRKKCYYVGRKFFLSASDFHDWNTSIIQTFELNIPNISYSKYITCL